MPESLPGGGTPAAPEVLFRINEAETIFECFTDEIVAIQLTTGAYYTISGTGIDTFLLLSLERSTREIAEALAEKYDASPLTIEQYIAPFLDRLREESLIGSWMGETRQGQIGALSHSGARLAFTPPSIEPFHDLEHLFLIDPVHDVGPAGWPQANPTPASVDDGRYRLVGSTGMIFERFDNESFAMHLETGACYTISGAAEDIFLLLPQEPTRAEVVRALSNKYAAPERELERTASDFLNHLVGAGLAEQEPLETPQKKDEIRQLEISRPGSALPFAPPELISSHAQPNPAPARSGSPRAAAADLKRKRYQIRPGVIFQMAGLQAVVLNPEKGYYYLLNASAAVALQLLQQKPTSTELVNALQRIYRLPNHEISAAMVVLLVDNLTQEGLAEVEEAPEGVRNLDLGRWQLGQRFEPFSVEVHRDLQHFFLPFPGAAGEGSSALSNSRDLAARMREYYAKAASPDHASEATFCIANAPLRVRCAGGIQADELCLAFSHLKTDCAAPEFTIHAWDCESEGAPEDRFLSLLLRDLHFHWEGACGPHGEVAGFHSPELPVLYHPGPDILSVVDVANRTAHFLKRDASPLPYWEIGSPFRAILHILLSNRGMQFVHGAAVGNEAGGVLLAGKGGAGKSTTALACLDAGMRYAGDDYCAVSITPGPLVHSLYNTAKLKGECDLERFPHLRDRIWNPDCLVKNNGDKATFFLSQWCPDQVASGFPLRAILIPHITGKRDSALEECSEAEALMAISASTIAQLPMAGSEDMERLSQLVGRLPRYTLHLGTDLTQIPALIENLLRA